MANPNGIDASVRISYDEMQGFLSLPPLGRGQKYSFDDVISILERKAIRYGVNETVIREMIEKEQYNRERLVATGIQKVDGIDGYYQLNFSTDFNTKPTIRPDGSVDYWSVHVVELVEEGQVLAVYHEPSSGENGMTVTGKPQIAKRGRPLLPMTGKGFTRSEDGKVYIASISGKIEKSNNRIQISPVYEVYGNIDLKTGNIDFRGDVIVHGNVLTGASIEATGSVTVDGVVEAAYISADKDVILRGGLLGKGKAVVKSKGNITAKFLEYATVEAEGFLNATSALDCDIIVHDRLLMSATNAIIVGGKVYAARGIELYNCGNDSEVHTELQVGMDKVMYARVIAINDELSTKNAMLDKVNLGLKQLEELAANQGIDISKDERRLGLLRARIATKADIDQLTKELNYYEAIIEGARGATIQIHNDVYPGVYATVDNITKVVQHKQYSVEFFVRNGETVMIPVKF